MPRNPPIQVNRSDFMMNAHRVVALAHPPQSMFELSIPAQVFGTSAPELTPWYRFSVCAMIPGQVQTAESRGALDVSDCLSALRAADTVVIPGWGGIGATAGSTRAVPSGHIPRPIVEALREAHTNNARIVSLGAGAFAVAEAGLLSGRGATTHSRWVGELAGRYPDVEVRGEVLYIDHGDVATSAGGGAGLDLCLHLVRVDHGAACAADVARGMVLPPHREGSQAQSVRPIPANENVSAMSSVLEWAEQHLAEHLTIPVLAGQARMSCRTFIRNFTQEIGMSPGRWVLARRVSVAQELLERTDLTVEAIASRVGLYSAVNLRTHFRRLVGSTPSQYRRSFPGPRG